MPYECEDNRDRYNDYMSKIVAFCNDINSTCIFIVADFNADISKSSAFGRILHDFCDDFSFSIVDKDYLPAETYTYVSSAWGTTSWLDHVICTADARECITDMTVLYECICSDHHPLLFCIDFDFVPAYGTGSTSENKRAIHWDSLRPCDINNYTDYTELELNKIKVPQGIKCNDPNCRNHSHREEIDVLYDCMIVQRAAARVVLGLRRRDHHSMTAALQRLHWLPVAYRIRFKLLTLMHAAIHANTPRYLADRVSAYNPSRSLRSADLSLLVVPRVNSERFGRRAFSVAGPSLWNSLPLVLRTQKDDERFRRDLKTHLYKQAFM